MKTFLKVVCALTGAFLSINALSATIPNKDDPTTFLGPTLKGSYSAGAINDYTAYSVAGEVGVKNYRVGGTLGWKLAENQRLKLSAEYLWQNINYAFFSGNSYEWVNQGALGADYQYDFMNSAYNPQFDLQAYASHAPSKSLSTRAGSYVNALGITQLYVDPRRIAGSNAAGLAPGISVAPWQGGKVGVDLNYDNVRYDTTRPPSQDAKGFGGTFHISQMLNDAWSIGGAAGVRQPFNNYSAYIDWRTDSAYGGTWLLGLDGAYNHGKHTLPNTWNVGLGVNYLMDKEAAPVGPSTYKGTGLSSQTVTNNFVGWVQKPGVYMPQVLAIVDPRQIIMTPVPAPTPSCTGRAPTFVGPIPTQFVTFLSTTNVLAGPYFTGTGLTYAISVSPAVTPPNTITVNAATGVVAITQNDFGDTSTTVTVTATNSCGSASGSFDVFFQEVPPSK